MSMSAADIYADCLLPLKEGYPLFLPELPDRRNAGACYETYRREGIGIGDVGIITPDGDFDFLFNICNVPRSDDPLSDYTEMERVESGASRASVQVDGPHGVSGSLSRTSLTPSNFPGSRGESSAEQRAVGASSAVPTGIVLIDPGEIRVRSNYFHPNHPYRASGREERANFEIDVTCNPISVVPLGVGVEAGWTFECASKRGAVTVTPGGATLTEVLQERRFLRSIGSTKAWFKYASEERERQFTSLILVTGVIKCRSWSVAAISNSTRTHSGKVALTLTPAATTSLSASYSWREYLPNMCNSGPDPPSQTENQCVFIRGYRIMKQTPALRFLRKVKAADLRRGDTDYYSLDKPADLRVTAGSSEDASLAMQQPLVRGSGSLANSDFQVGDSLDNQSATEEDTDEDYVVEKLSGTSEPYHPSDVINRYLLDQIPEAEYAMTHDKEWWALMKDNEPVCPDRHELLNRVCKTYQAAFRTGKLDVYKTLPILTCFVGVIFLEKKEDLYMQSMKLSIPSLFRPKPLAPKKKALLIGVQYSLEGGSLDYDCHRDVMELEKLLLKVYGYDRRDIVVMRDGIGIADLEPTRANILREVESLVRDAQPGDHFVFHYTGHSTQQDSQGVNEEDGKDECLVPTDARGARNLIRDNELRRLLVDDLPAGSTLVTIIDACPSKPMLDLEHYRCNRVYTPWKGMQTLGRKSNTAVHRDNMATNTKLKRPPWAPGTRTSHRNKVASLRSSQVPSATPLTTHYSFPTSPIQFTESPSRLCTGFCDHAPVRTTETAYVLCLSACKDDQIGWMNESLTMAMIDTLKEFPYPTLRDLMTTLSHRIHEFHSVAREWEKNNRGSSPHDKGRGSEENSFEPGDFQDPQLASHSPLDMDAIFTL